MKTILIRPLTILFAFLTVLCTQAFAQPFEGEIEMNLLIHQPGTAEQPMIIRVKDTKMKVSIDIPEMPMEIYYDWVNKRVVTVMPTRNMGLEMSTDAIKPDTGFTDALAKPTGKQSTINGFACDEYITTKADGDGVIMWVTKDIPRSLHTLIFDGVQRVTQGATSGESYKAFLANGYVPVRTVVLRNNEEVATVTMKRVESKPVPDATFEIPASITIQKLPEASGK